MLEWARAGGLEPRRGRRALLPCRGSRRASSSACSTVGSWPRSARSATPGSGSWACTSSTPSTAGMGLGMRIWTAAMERLEGVGDRARRRRRAAGQLRAIRLRPRTSQRPVRRGGSRARARRRRAADRCRRRPGGRVRRAVLRCAAQGVPRGSGSPSPGRRHSASDPGGACRATASSGRRTTGTRSGRSSRMTPVLPRAILDGLVHHAGEGATVFLDVPEPNTDGVALARERGLVPVFETARMYRGGDPQPAARSDLRDHQLRARLRRESPEADRALPVTHARWQIG